MAVSVLKWPITTYNTFASRFVASGNPVHYYFQRMDGVSNNADVGSGVNFLTISTDVSGFVFVDDVIYISGVGNRTVTAVGWNGSRTLINVTGSNWTATTGQYFFKQRLNYKLQIRLTDAREDHEDEELFSYLEYADDATGRIDVDISSFIDGLISAENDFDYTTSTILSFDEHIIQMVNVLYRETWTGSAESEDDAPMCFIVMASKQIGEANGSNLAEFVLTTQYITSDVDAVAKFLTKFDTIKHWKGYPGSVDILYEIGQDEEIKVKLESFDANGSSLGIEVEDLTSDTNDSKALRINFPELLHDDAKTANLWITAEKVVPEEEVEFSLVFDKDFDSSWNQEKNLYPDTIDTWTDNPGSWDFPSGYARQSSSMYQVPYLGSAGISKPIEGAYPGTYMIDYTNLQIDDIGFRTDFVVYFFKDGEAIGTDSVELVNGANTGSLSVILSELADEIKLAITSLNVVPVSYEFVMEKIEISATLLVPEHTIEVTITEVKPIEVLQPCANPVLLYFRNSIGGDSFWMFDYNQNLLWQYNDKKRKVLTLFADNVSINEWDSLQDINTLGLLRGVPYFDIADTNKSEARDGQQLYVMKDDGSKLGVTAIPTSLDRMTKNSRESFQCNILYPEYFTA